MENKDLDPGTITDSRDRVDGQDEGGSRRKGIGGRSLQSLVYTPVTKDTIQREIEKGIPIGEQLRRLLGPSRKWVIYY